MENRTTELLEEINQILEQYRREVPGRRRAWPQSIKERVLKLRGEGLNITTIAKQTNLPYYTVLKWHHESTKGTFEQLKIVPNVVTATELSAPKKVTSVTEATFDPKSTVSISLPSGIRLEGVSFSFLLQLLPKLGVVIA